MIIIFYYISVSPITCLFTTLPKAKLFQLLFNTSIVHSHQALPGIGNAGIPGIPAVRSDQFVLQPLNLLLQLTNGLL